jgi:hypothetical protein
MPHDAAHDTRTGDTTMSNTTPALATMSPRIGQLCRNGQTVFYAFLAGGLYVEDFDWTTLQFYVDCEER